MTEIVKVIVSHYMNKNEGISGKLIGCEHNE